MTQPEIQLDLIPEAADVSDGVANSPAVLDPDGLDPVVEAILNHATIAIDTETTGLDYMRDALHGVSITAGENDWYVTGRALPVFLPTLADISQRHHDKLWVGHNLKFDKHFLGRYGFRPTKIADTMIAQWLVNENMELGLKDLAHSRLGRPELPDFKDLLMEAKKRLGRKRMDQVSIYDVDLGKLAEYAARDTRLTADLWQLLQHDLSVEGMENIFWNMEMPFVDVLLEMEENGMFVDQAKVAALRVEFEAKLQEAENRWNGLTGGVNYNSNPQLQKLFFEQMKLPVQIKTKKGAPSVDVLVLQRLAEIDQSGIVQALQDIRSMDKMVNTFIVMLEEKPFNGYLHGNFNQTGTVTGRLSSSDPNQQNIPSRGDLGKKMRGVFGVEPGDMLLDIDYSQIELRMLTHESQDPNFLKIFQDGGDPHQMTADLAKVSRAVGKTINFGWGYGMGPRKLADTIEKAGQPRPKEQDARKWLNDFNHAYPVLVKWKEKVIKRARQLGYVPSIGGRKRRLPDLTSPVDGFRWAAERQCVNSRIQGSCGDMLKWAMLELRPWMKMYPDVKLTCQVHDELLFRGPEAAVKEFAPIASGVMASIERQFDLSVAVEAEPGMGYTWSEAK